MADHSSQTILSKVLELITTISCIRDTSPADYTPEIEELHTAISSFVRGPDIRSPEAPNRHRLVDRSDYRRDSRDDRDYRSRDPRDDRDYRADREYRRGRDRVASMTDMSPEYVEMIRKLIREELGSIERRDSNQHSKSNT